jgi:release factor glutamine methyltransferase
VTVSTALRQAVASGLDRLDAQVLLLHALDRAPTDRAWLIAHDRDPLDPPTLERFETLCRHRRSGTPVAYLTGRREFHGLDLQVDARVLDPRPDTETLVDWALDCLNGRDAPLLLDLGTGSGAIALALQHRRPDAQVWALDASADALAVARANAARLDLPVRFLKGHWLSGWANHGTGVPQTFDLIVSNPPYIAADDPHLDRLTHEPPQALVSGADGLDDIRLIVTSALPHLKPGGWLLLEHGWNQAGAVAALLHAAGYADIGHRADLAGHTRCTGARRG